MPNVLFADSFDHYGTSDVLKKWSSNYFSAYQIGTTSGNMRHGTNYFQNAPAASGEIKTLSTTYTELYVEFAFRSSQYGTFLSLLDSGGTVHLNVSYNSPGEWTVARSATTLGTTVGARANLNTWTHVGFYAKVDDTTGAYTLKINGQTVLNATGVDTRNGANANFQSIRFAHTGDSANNTLFDDVVISSNGFCGDCKVKAQMPTASGTYGDFTPSTGLDYQCIDETSMNSDTDYISSSTTGHKSTFTFPTVAVAGTVHALQFNATVRKDDAGSHTVRPVLRISGTDYYGTTVSVSDSYTMISESFPLNPATNAAWTTSEIDATELGLEVVS